jgi:uncharacterized membrane protein HdeD (DUF308 family)
VSVPDATTVHSARYWFVPLLRAVPAAIVAVIITFSADHSTTLGYFTFGAFALVSGIAVGVGSYLALDARPRTMFIVQAIIGIALGIAALAFAGSGLPFLLFLMSGWAAFTGFLELYSGLRGRARIASSRDWIFAGGLTAVLAIVVLVIPADYQQAFTGPDDVERQLTASVIIVGVFGAYAALLAVYFVIAGLSLKWAGSATTAIAGSN